MNRIITFNYENARKSAGPGKLPVLTRTDGTKVVLLPNGMNVKQERFLKGPATITGKQARKLRIAEHRKVSAP